LAFTAALLFSPIYSIHADEAADAAQEQQYQQLLSQRDQLKSDIESIDSETTRCNKQKKGWTAATVVGSVGVAATGTAAIVQGVQTNKKKSELEDLKSQKY
jgi:hypothetical protein